MKELEASKTDKANKSQEHAITWLLRKTSTPTVDASLIFLVIKSKLPHTSAHSSSVNFRNTRSTPERRNMNALMTTVPSPENHRKPSSHSLVIIAIYTDILK
jgi:hypothetical protein